MGSYAGGAPGFKSQLAGDGGNGGDGAGGGGGTHVLLQVWLDFYLRYIKTTQYTGTAVGTPRAPPCMTYTLDHEYMHLVH